MFELENGGVIVLHAVSAAVPYRGQQGQEGGVRVSFVGGEAYLPEEEGKRLIEALKKLHSPTLQLPMSSDRLPQWAKEAGRE